MNKAHGERRPAAEFVASPPSGLVTDAGEELLEAGDRAASKAGDPDRHHLINRSGADATVLEMGASDFPREARDYPDIDMIARPAEDHYRRRDGTAYAKVERG